MAGIGIIANPHSKLNKRNPKRHEILSYIAGDQSHFKLTHNLQELREVAREFKEKKVQILGINGGDGTICHTLSVFIEEYGNEPLPKIAVLKGGTMNMLALNLCIKGKPEQVLYRLMEKYSSSQPMETKKITSLKFSNGHHGFIFADGTSAAFLEEFYRNKTGALGSLLLVVKVLVSFLIRGKLFRKIVQKKNIKWTTNKTEMATHSTLGVFCSSVAKLPLGATLFPHVEQSHEAFEIVSVAMKPEQLVYRVVPNFFLGAANPSYGKIRFCASKLQIEYESEQAYTIDGELFETEDKKVEIFPGPTIEFLLI